MTVSLDHPLLSPAAVPGAGALPREDLDLTLLARRPPRLTEATERAVASAPLPEGFDLCRSSCPAASVVVVSYDNLLLTKLCVASVIATADETLFELIVVDNGSADGTAEYLRDLERANRGVRVIFNQTNRGFAAATNAGLRLAQGSALVLLNNDTVPAPGWLGRLLRHLEDGAVGLVGPVTNRIGNEAEVEAGYRTYGEMAAFAEEQFREHRGRAFDIPVPCMFCLAMRRDVFERVGPLDERFEVGMLEDDDYARRARGAGYRLVCARNVFVHHFGQGSFGKLVPSGEYMRVLEANQQRYRQKWGEAWKAYGRRPDEGYEQLRIRLRRMVHDLLPHNASVGVVTRGDEELLRFDGRAGYHFPCADDGTYAGHYPADGGEAVAWLRRLRERGAEYFLVPATARWWLTHYAELGKYLSDHCDLLAEREETGVLFALPERTASDEGPAPDYRGFVGPADKYDLVGAMQFNLLTALGLREHHRLLDVGCGSLRGGRLFIPYLLPGHYFGIEPAQWLVREGFERELGQDMQRVKWPNFHHGNDFQLSVFGRSFDFIIAQSIFSHAATCQIRRCLSEAAKVMKPRAIFAATYFEASEDYSGTEWVYPECVGYTFEHLIGLAREQGLACARLNWPHPNGQQWVVFFRQGLARISEGLLSAVATSAVPGGGR